MGQVLQRSAITTEAVRRAIQHSQESMRALARRHGINRRRLPSGRSASPLPIAGLAQPFPGPRFCRSNRKPSLWRFIVVWGAMASAGCLMSKATSPGGRSFDTYPIGFFHLDLAEVRTAEGKLYLFVAIDRTSKFAIVELVEKADTRADVAFLEALVEAVPYRIHTVLTDNGIQFADLAKNRQGATARFRGHPFDRLCFVHEIEHRLTKPNHPWTNEQVERMNRTIKEATVKRYFYDTHNQLKAHLNDFLQAYNFARRLKTLKGLTPYECLCKLWTQTPDSFTLKPIHQRMGPNN